MATVIAVAIAITATKKQKVRKKNDLHLPVAPDNIHPWRDRREAEYQDMSYTEEEKYDHDRSYFLGIIFQALVSKLLTSQDMVDILKIVSNRENAIAEQFILDKRKAVTVRVTDDELQHVSYDDAQLGRDK